MIKFLTHVSHFPAIFYLLYVFNLSFDAQNFFLEEQGWGEAVAILSRYQSPVDWRSRNVEGNLMHKVNYHYCCHFPGLECM